MIRDNMWWCSPDSSDKEEYSKSVQIVTDVLQSLFRKVREIDWKKAQEEALMKIFSGLGKISDVSTLAEKMLENDKAIKVAEIKADDEDPKWKEWEMRGMMSLGMFEEMD